ncbi:TetR/AcrR family transcriptional regulator [Agromyces humatus]|nr:TetR family transcriptional regulator [Agromyces humatus]
MRSLRMAATSDLTSRARVRDAAIVRFGRDGFEVGLRAIAKDAGVSAAGIVKLFGSKDGLREACDEHVFAVVRDTKREVLADRGAPGAFIGQLAMMDGYRPMIAYTLRSIQAGGEHARDFIEHMVADAVEYVAAGVEAGVIVPSRDEEARVRFLLGSTLGSLLLELSMNTDPDAIDTAAFWERALGRLTLPALELYTEGFLVDRDMLDAYLLYIPDPPAEAAGRMA